MVLLRNVTISNCGTGISAPANAPIAAHGLNIQNCKLAIELRDPPSLKQQLGLSSDTPDQILVKVLKYLNKPNLTQGEVEKKISSSKLRNWIGAGADIMTVSASIFQMYQGGLLEKALSALTS